MDVAGSGMIDAAAFEVVTEWISAAQKGDLDRLLELSTDDVSRSLTSQVRDSGLAEDDEFFRPVMSVAVQRRFEHIDLDACGVLSHSRLVGVNLEEIVIVTDPDVVALGVAGAPMDGLVLCVGQGELFTVHLTGRAWRVAGWGGTSVRERP